MGHVLNFPLYDGNCSPAARALLAQGDVGGALAEWRRLADLGSGRARCVLAFVALNGTPSTEPDIEEARRLATSALSGERGYANFLLACIALKENQAAAIIAPYLGECHKAGFLPGIALLASLAVSSPGISKERRDLARNLLRKTAKAGYPPARLALCLWYVRGVFGFAHRVLGFVMMPVAIAKVAWAAKYRGFSLASFRFLTHSRVPLFGDASQLAAAREGTVQPRYLNLLRATHIVAATLVAVVAVSQSADRSDPVIAGWIAVSAWPYAVSYLLAATIVARNLMATAVQTFLLVLITAFTCNADLGRLFDLPLGLAVHAGISVLAMLALVTASGYGKLAANRLVRTPEPVRHRQLILSAHAMFGLLAALAVLVRSTWWRAGTWPQHGIDVVMQAMLAALPYGVAALFALPLITENRWKPKAYLGVLFVGTVLAVTSNSGVLNVSQGFVVMVQFIGFILAAEWALDGNEW